MSPENEVLLDILFSGSPGNKLKDFFNETPPLDKQSQQIIEVFDNLTKATQPMQPDANVKRNLMKTISGEFTLQGFVNRLSLFFDLSKEEILKILEKAHTAPQNPWYQMGGGGIYLMDIVGGQRVAEADCGLVYMEPGTQFPMHRHLGDEMALILAGEIREHTGEIKQAGDQILRSLNSEHSFSITSRDPAIIAIVLFKGYEFI